MSLDCILIAIVLAACSGAPGACMGRSSVWGQRIAVGFMGAGALVGLAGAGLVLLGLDAGRNVVFPWPAVGDSVVGVDSLSAFFLAPVFLMGGLGSIYSLGYWPQDRHPENGRTLHVSWGMLVAGMGLLVIAKHAMAFLLGWEIMALSAFFLVSTEDHRDECRRVGWIYLVASHVSTLTLFALFSAWRWATGSYALLPVTDDTIALSVLHGLFFLALFGFGLKAGVMPLHFWLPGAHANSPSHVSAMLSGVVLKMGVYGLARFLFLLPDPPGAWGGLVLTLGAVSGLLGVLFAIGQHDLKRLLAYHSVENIGIILMGLGVAMLGRSAQRPEWIVLGLAGALLHVWNHGLFKSLLFLCAGSVVHGARTQQIDQLGGLAKRMPFTASMFLVGAAAICGLPPLNGFVSELLVYLGLFRTVTSPGAVGSAAVIAAPVLAMIGALAVACFVKVYGAVFLGTPRARDLSEAREASLSMRAPMAVLAVCCALIGLAPVLTAPLLDRVVACVTPLSPLAERASLGLGTLVPLRTVGLMSMALLACVGALALVLKMKSRAAPRVDTWDCGYAQASSRIQYTASSFAQIIVTMFTWVLRPRAHQPYIHGPFPKAAKMSSHVDDIVLDRALAPVARSVERGCVWIHQLQQGLTQHYVLYILIALVFLLSTLLPIDGFLSRLFAR
jgi:hydrogenase-4 component B